jgi:hypothetical protein
VLLTGEWVAALSSNCFGLGGWGDRIGRLDKPIAQQGYGKGDTKINFIFLREDVIEFTIMML